MLKDYEELRIVRFGGPEHVNLYRY